MTVLSRSRQTPNLVDDCDPRGRRRSWAGQCCTSPLPRPPARRSPAVTVDTASASRADVPIYLQGLGTVQAFYTVTVTARVDGELQRVAFTEGQTVHKGDLLAQIDPRPNQAAFDQAVATKVKDEAQLANAKRDFERYTKLQPQDLASKQTVDTQRALVDQLAAQLKVDQAVIDNARTQLEYTRITSPITGRTGIRLVDPGNIVHGGELHRHRRGDPGAAHFARFHAARGTARRRRRRRSPPAASVSRPSRATVGRNSMRAR